MAPACQTLAVTQDIRPSICTTRNLESRSRPRGGWWRLGCGHVLKPSVKTKRDAFASRGSFYQGRVSDLICTARARPARYCGKCWDHAPSARIRASYRRKRQVRHFTVHFIVRGKRAPMNSQRRDERIRALAARSTTGSPARLTPRCLKSWGRKVVAILESTCQSMRINRLSAGGRP